MIVQATCPCSRPRVPPFHDPHAGQSDGAERAAAASGKGGRGQTLWETGQQAASKLLTVRHGSSLLPETHFCLMTVRLWG